MQSKVCTRCNTDKPLEDFPKVRRGKYHRGSICKKCTAEQAKPRYDRAVKKRLELVRAFKDVPCTDCGQRYPYYVMDFDHLGEKNFLVGQAANKLVSIDKLIDEMLSCDVVCSNCHRIRTYKRRVEAKQCSPHSGS